MGFKNELKNYFVDSCNIHFKLKPTIVLYTKSTMKNNFESTHSNIELNKKKYTQLNYF